MPALLGCHTWGDSYEHLLEMLQDAIQGWLEVASDRKKVHILEAICDSVGR